MDAQRGSRRAAAVATLAAGFTLIAGEARAPSIAAGRHTMPGFRASYTDEEPRDLAAYVAERLGPAND